MKLSFKIWLLGMVLSQTLVVSSSVMAQSMIIIGEGSNEQACYQASTRASQLGFASNADLEKCNKAIKRGMLLKSNLVATYVNRGVIHGARKEYSAAAKDYNYAIELDPTASEAYLNRGNLWFISNHAAEAIEDYQKALDLGIAKKHIALLNRGMAQESRGNFRLAKEDYLQALSIREEWATAKEKLERVNKKIK